MQKLGLGSMSPAANSLNIPRNRSCHMKRQHFRKNNIRREDKGKKKASRPRRRWIDNIQEQLPMSVVKAGGIALRLRFIQRSVWAAKSQAALKADCADRHTEGYTNMVK